MAGRRLRWLALPLVLAGMTACQLGGDLEVTVVSPGAIQITLVENSSATREGCLGSGDIQRTNALDGSPVHEPVISFTVHRSDIGTCRKTLLIDGQGPTELFSGRFPLPPGAYRVASSYGIGTASGTFEIR